jgi:hypothetical protein
MVRRFALAALALFVGCSLAGRATASPQDELKDAAKKVADASNYSWKSAVENLGDNGGPAGATEGQTTKDGLTHLTIVRGDNTIESFFKGEKGVMKMGDDWKSLAEAEGDNGGQPNYGRFIVRMIRNFRAPATQAMDVAPDIKDLKEGEGGALAGTLTEDGAKQLLNFGRRGGANAGNAADNNGPQIANAKGTAKFWVKDGQLAKMEYTVQGTISFNGNDREINRKTTVEIKDVGSTTLDVPADVKKKME